MEKNKIKFTDVAYDTYCFLKIYWSDPIKKVAKRAGSNNVHMFFVVHCEYEYEDVYVEFPNYIFNTLQELYKRCINENGVMYIKSYALSYGNCISKSEYFLNKVKYSVLTESEFYSDMADYGIVDKSKGYEDIPNIGSFDVGIFKESLKKKIREKGIASDAVVSLSYMDVCKALKESIEG